MGGTLSVSQRALEALFARTTGKSRLGLERTLAVLAEIGDPHLAIPTFHIAGTNGKGSVCATMEAVLRAQGHAVGRYTSPHLVDFRERVLINGRAVSEDFVASFIEAHMPRIERIGATFFEATTAMAMAWFVQERADVVIVETGLGGRLDSSNVVRPLVAAVTSIGIDHTEQLGNTRASIAWEKSGIFKPGTPAVVGEPDALIAALLIDHARRNKSAPLIDVWRATPPRNVVVSEQGTSFDFDAEGIVYHAHTPLAGAHQASNTLSALHSLRLAGDKWWPDWTDALASLASVRLPGRFHREGAFIFDVAHNPDGARVLARTLTTVAPERPVVALVCVLDDKDWRGLLSALSNVADVFVLTNAPTAPESRSWSLNDVAAYAQSMGWRFEAEPDFDQAIGRSSVLGATVVVTGSFHTVGDAMSRLQVDPLAG
jgi:dihydrofolate synthase/folylpolyglutamate synthase